MPLRLLIIPDKFKGTISAWEAGRAIQRGWQKGRPQDAIEILPMSDGGDGFGDALKTSLRGRQQVVKTMDAAHRPCKTTWWWDAKSRTAIIESSRTIGLAMLPTGKFHPFKLDTFGL